MHFCSSVGNPAVAQNTNDLKVVMVLVMQGCSVTFFTGKKFTSILVGFSKRYGL